MKTNMSREELEQKLEEFKKLRDMQSGKELNENELENAKAGVKPIVEPMRPDELSEDDLDVSFSGLNLEDSIEQTESIISKNK